MKRVNSDKLNFGKLLREHIDFFSIDLPGDFDLLSHYPKTQQQLFANSSTPLAAKQYNVMIDHDHKDLLALVELFKKK